jgi:hypothetical protein
VIKPLGIKLGGRMRVIPLGLNRNRQFSISAALPSNHWTNPWCAIDPRDHGKANPQIPLEGWSRDTSF